jgi:hypothetical protein
VEFTNFDGYRNFLQSCFNAGVLSSIDEIGLHLYRSRPEGAFDYLPDSTVDTDPALAGMQPQASFAEEMASLRSFIDGYQPGFPVRNTEEGFHLGSGRQDTAQFKYLTRMILVEHAAGVEEITCFRLRAPRRSDYPADPAYDNTYAEASKFPGLIDQNADNSFTPRPAYYGLKNMAQYLVNADVYHVRSVTQSIAGNTVRIEIYSRGEDLFLAYWIDEAIDDSLKTVRNISITMEGIADRNYNIIDIHDNSSLATGSYIANGSNVTFDSLPVTDYPFILHVH